jgi:stage III sporulation protein AF
VEVVRSFVKNYFIFLLLLQIIAYLVPKDSYKKYVQFFTGVLMAVVLLRPVLSWMEQKSELSEYIQWDALMEQIEELEKNGYEGEGEDMFEIFFMEDSTE